MSLPFRTRPPRRGPTTRARRALLLVGIAAGALAGACGRDPVSAPADSDVLGGYMLYRGISDRTDLGAFEVTDAVTGAPATRAHIGSVRLTLEPGGVTRGRFIARIRQLDGVLDTLDVDLGGRWTRSGDTVRLAHDADTFLRDLPFVARDGLLTGENVFSGVRVRVVLVRP